MTNSLFVLFIATSTSGWFVNRWAMRRASRPRVLGVISSAVTALVALGWATVSGERVAAAPAVWLLGVAGGVGNAIGYFQQLEFEWAHSEASFRQALEHSTETLPISKFRIEALLGIGVARLELGHAADAEKWVRQADEAARGTYPNFIPVRADIIMNLGRALLAQGNVPAAREAFAAADNYWRGFDASNRSAGEAAFWLAQAMRAAKANREARVEFTRAVKILEASPLRADAKLVQAARLVLAR